MSCWLILSSIKLEFSWDNECYLKNNFSKNWHFTTRKFRYWRMNWRIKREGSKITAVPWNSNANSWIKVLRICKNNWWLTKRNWMTKKTKLRSLGTTMQFKRRILYLKWEKWVSNLTGLLRQLSKNSKNKNSKIWSLLNKIVLCFS